MVGGILVVSVEALKRDPEYDVHTVRLRFDESVAAGDKDGDSAVGGPEPAATAGNALSVETIREVSASEWDSVADLRMQLQAELGLPEQLRQGGRQRGGGHHELIFRGQLLGEHLFLGPDYEIADGDLVHFAVACASSPGGARAASKRTPEHE